MAGAGWRDFVPGEVLTAANVQDYLQDQAVMTFASAAARTAALASPTEGMVSYLSDTNIVQMYTGSSWVTVADDNGLPIANGGTGSTTVAEARTALGIKIVQVQTLNYSSTITTNSTSYQAAANSIAITPSSASNNIFITVTGTASIANRTAVGYFTLFRNGVAGTNLGGTSGIVTSLYPADSLTSFQSIALSYLDSPNTTSATTYTLAMRCSAAGQTLQAQPQSDQTVITVMEVAA